jgi:hypothetical protein
MEGKYRVDAPRLARLLWCGGQFEKFRGQLRTDAFILMFEKYIRMIPLLREDSLFPVQQISAAVFRAPQPDVAPCCGGD